MLDIKPWDDETDMTKLEECVRAVQMPGLHWGACKSRQCLNVIAVFCLARENCRDSLRRRIPQDSDFMNAVVILHFPAV